MKTFDLNDVMHIEGDSDYDDYYSSLQRAINDGMWSLQGSYGRAMMAAIEEGRCMLGRTAHRDYFGNRIPSRDEVQSGTKGSAEFVSKRHGADWLDLMEAV